ncbi:hypothetical protein WMY93_006754 [Mugilogobius chulae]|uniref:Zinc finger protein 865 n=1 Tax=Mugilogobius chulae TaxID=88201 RepID=A0AAW0PP74_9GOBI
MRLLVSSEQQQRLQDLRNVQPEASGESLTSHVEPKEEPEPELSIKQEPEEFHVIIVKTEGEADEDESCELQEEKREETEAGCSSDPLTQFHSDSEEHTDSSEEAPLTPKRSYAMIPPDAELQDHRPYSCSDPQRPYSCSDCGKSFKKKQVLNQHMWLHAGVKPQKCPSAARTFRGKRIFTRRRERGGTSEDSRSCGRALQLLRPRTLQLLRVWQDVQVEDTLTGAQVESLGEKPQKCVQCEKIFKRNTDMNKHMLSHSRDKPLKCPVCGKGCSKQHNLSEHLKTHELLLSCPVCARTFSRKHDVKQHMLTHTGEKPHSCSVCHMSFAHKSSFRRHLKNQHHTCAVCDQSFRDDTSLEEHVRSHVDNPEPSSCPD